MATWLFQDTLTFNANEGELWKAYLVPGNRTFRPLVISVSYAPTNTPPLNFNTGGFAGVLQLVEGMAVVQQPTIYVPIAGSAMGQVVVGRGDLLIDSPVAGDDVYQWGWLVHVHRWIVPCEVGLWYAV